MCYILRLGDIALGNRTPLIMIEKLITIIVGVAILIIFFFFREEFNIQPTLILIGSIIIIIAIIRVLIKKN